MAINPAHYYTGDVTAVLPDSPTFSGTGTFGKISVGGGALGAGDVAAFGGPVLFDKLGIGSTDFSNPQSKDIVFAVLNNNDNDMDVRLRAGDGTQERRCYWRFEDYLGSQKWLAGRNALGAWIKYDTDGVAHREYYEPGGKSSISSAGTGAVEINYGGDANTGTGGFRVGGGGGASETWFKVGGSGETIIRGPAGGMHTALRTDEVANSQQTVRFGVRHYSNTSTYMNVFYAVSGSSFNNLDIGGGTGAMQAPTLIRLSVGATNTSGAGEYKTQFNQYGVAVGTAAPTPTSGRAFQVSTTAFANALYVADSTGHVFLANDNQGLYVGAGADAYLSHNGTNSYFGNKTGVLYVFQEANADLIVRANHASGGNIQFQTRGSSTAKASINGFAGINLAEGDPTGGSGSPPALQLFWSDQGDNKLIAVDPSGAVYSVDLTAL